MEEKMKVLVFGGSGRTGKIIVNKLLEDGYPVTAFVRNPGKVKHITKPGFNHIRGDIRDAAAVELAVKDCDIVVSALGNLTIFPNTIISDGTATILRAMQQHKKTRLIFMSSLGVGDSKGQLGWLHNWFYLPTFLRSAFKDKERQEKIIHSSGLRWTVVRPAHFFFFFPLPLRYRICVMPSRPRLLPVMSRYHTADFIVKECERNNYVQKNVALSYF
jgi:uncharacterized protein YbjT (DUF2867 family)